MSVLGYIIVTVEFKKEDDRWVGRCLELGTSAYSDTFEEAQEALADLIALHLDALENVGERQHFLSQRGIRFFRQKPPYRTSRVVLPIDESSVTQRQLVAVG